jgi:sodium-dependent dicarboxylate transporter 2/3/5
MLGIAFSANAGGIATVIGTPPNSVLIGFLENEYNTEISFFKWMLLGLPFSIVLITIIYLILVKLMFPTKGLLFKSSHVVIETQLKKLGKITFKEKIVLRVFIVVVFLWVFRTVINGYLPDIKLTDTLISVFGAIALFTIPYNLKKGQFILEWSDTKNLPWGILILFGGGLALAKGMSSSGIVEVIAATISKANLSVLLTATTLIVLMLFMTELMSNVALIAVLAPVVAGIAIGMNIPVLYLLIPVTMASSCAFMLPMATPPNAIVFASGHIKVHEMARVGALINIIAILLLILLFRFFIPLFF